MYQKDQKTLNEWKNKRMTGFSLSWHLEDSQGKKLEVELNTDPQWKKDNGHFIRLTNLVHYYTKTLGNTKQSFKNIVADVKATWLNQKAYVNYNRYCDKGKSSF